MKQKQKCSKCGRDYWTAMLKVYVYKKRVCTDCKAEMIKSSDGQTFTCPKCHKVFHKSVPMEWNTMGTRIEGSTQSFDAKEKRLREEPNTEIENVMVPENLTCQQCKNWETRSTQATQKRERKLAFQGGVPDDLREVPDTVTNADLYKFEIRKKINEEYQEARKAEAYAKQAAEQKRLEDERKAKMKAEQLITPKEAFPTKEERTPLIDPETAKIIEEVKKKDARIAELKKKLEEAQKKDAEAKGAAKVLNGEK